MFCQKAKCKDCKGLYIQDKLALPWSIKYGYKCAGCRSADEQRKRADKLEQSMDDLKFEIESFVSNLMDERDVGRKQREREIAAMQKAQSDQELQLGLIKLQVKALAEAEEKRKHEKDMEQLRHQEAERQRKHDLEMEKIKNGLGKLEIEERYKCEIEKHKNQLKHEASMQIEDIERKRLENEKLRLEIEQLSTQNIPRRRRNFRLNNSRNDVLNSNRVFLSLPTNAIAAGADDGFND